MKKLLLFLTFASLMFGTAVSTFAQAMPAAIKIEPEGATAFDQIKLTFDAKLACTPDGKTNLIGLTQVAMHGAIKKLGTTWNSWGAPGVDYNGTPGGGFTTKLTSNGDDTYSMTFIPATYFGVTEEDGVFIGISCVFNNGTGWDSEGKDTGDGACIDFQIPLAYTTTDPVGNFYVNMKKIIEAEEFTAGVDKVYLVLDEVGTFDMIDLDAEFNSDSIYYIKVEAGIIKDSTYTYHYRINTATPETADPRSFTAMGGPNTFNDWWNDDPIVIPSTITFKLDMTYPIAHEIFVPGTDYIDVAGSFNGWGPAAGTYHLAVTDDTNIYSIEVDSLVAGTNYEFKFRLNSDWDNAEFPAGIYNRSFKPKAGAQELVLAYNTALNFTVDMTKAVNAGTFVDPTNYVDVAGAFTGWSGSAHLTSLGSNVFGIKIETVKPETLYGYKFRIDGSWDNSEYPGGGPNREYTTLYGYQTVHHFYDVSAGVPDLRLNSILFFPNPVSDILTVMNIESVDKIMISNMLGQEVKTVMNPGSSVEISTNDLQKGMYFLNFVAKDGNRRTEKILVN